MICEAPNYIIKETPTSKWEFFTHKDYIQKGVKGTVTEIPCGHCKACLQNKALQNFNINNLEFQNAKTAYFLTLTYNEENYTKSKTNVKTIRKFIHKLQDYYWNNFKLKNIKYFGVTEYGDNTTRFHSHIILYNIPIKLNDFLEFNCELPKKKLNWINHNVNEVYFTNNIIKRLWGKGNITISYLNQARINYVVNYLYKSFNNLTKAKRKELDKLEIEPPKKFQSKNLGLDYITKNKNKFLKNNLIYIGGKKIHANKYIDQKAKIFTEERSLKRLYKRMDQIRTNKTKRFTNHKGII